MTVLYALDFDGVLCDSVVETGITGWDVARQLWTDLPETMPQEMLELFRQVRPVMETGYEAVLIMRCLYEGVSPDKLLRHFDDLLRHIIRRDDIHIERLKQRFGQTRDAWIANNKDEWIKMNALFPGVADKLRQITTQQCFIVTTKQERFVRAILAANDIHFPADHIYGLERKQKKTALLTAWIKAHPECTIHFVEDRLPTLQQVMQNPALATVKLYLAEWGYNTDQDKKIALESPAITTINLADFSAL